MLKPPFCISSTGHFLAGGSHRLRHLAHLGQWRAAGAAASVVQRRVRAVWYVHVVIDALTAGSAHAGQRLSDGGTVAAAHGRASIVAAPGFPPPDAPPVTRDAS